MASPDAEKHLLANCAGLSGADIEDVLIRARMRAALDAEAAVGLDDLKAALEDFIPPSYPTEIELQVLASVLECTSRGLLPDKYRNADRAELIRRANELSSLVRDQARERSRTRLVPPRINIMRTSPCRRSYPSSARVRRATAIAPVEALRGE